MSKIQDAALIELTAIQTQINTLAKCKDFDEFCIEMHNLKSRVNSAINSISRMQDVERINERYGH